MTHGERDPRHAFNDTKAAAPDDETLLRQALDTLEWADDLIARMEQNDRGGYQRMNSAISALRERLEPAVRLSCWCRTCRPVRMFPPEDMRMVLCPTCGNKRCPHANHHANPCTGSNAPGQPGSAY